MLLCICTSLDLYEMDVKVKKKNQRVYIFIIIYYEIESIESNKSAPTLSTPPLPKPSNSLRTKLFRSLTLLLP